MLNVALERMQIVPNNFSFFAASGCPAGALKRPHMLSVQRLPPWKGPVYSLMRSEWGRTRRSADARPPVPFVADGLIHGRLVLETKLPVSDVEEEFIGLEILN